LEKVMNQADLSVLLSRNHSTQRSVLSVYLNVDQSDAGNLNRRFETRLRNLALRLRRAPVDLADRARFAEAMHHIQDFVSIYSPRGKGLALFFDTSDGFFWHTDLQFPVTDEIRWDRELFLQPMACAVDQLEAYGVALADRANVRLFVVSLGQIQEIVREDFDRKDVQRIKTAGTDHADSSSRIQHKADNQARLNLQHLVRRMERIAKSKGLQRFVLAGTAEIIAALRSLLSKRLASTVIGETDLAINAAPQRILTATRSIAEKYERDTEVHKVNQIVTSAAKKRKAVVGLGQTLRAINSGRVWEVVYCRGLVSPGFECPKCSALFSAKPSRCLYCSSRIQPVTNIIERAVEHALRKQAKIEAVTGDADAALRTAGGIGAFLRTRSGAAGS
jgi:hypothetical protein